MRGEQQGDKGSTTTITYVISANVMLGHTGEVFERRFISAQTTRTISA